MLKMDEKHTTKYCVALWQRDEQVKLATARIQDRVQPYDGVREEPCAIVGFGPSLRETWKQIKDFPVIFTCSGSHKFLIERGIIPTYDLNVDPRAHKVALMGPPHPDVTYLVASTCHPKLFDHLEGYRVLLWHIFDNAEESIRVLPQGEWSLTGGIDAGLRCMTMARFLGYTNLHFFGVDGSSPEQHQRHAGEHPHGKMRLEEVEYDGHTFLTTVGMLAAAQGIWHELNQLIDVVPTFHGDGLIQHMSKFWKREELKNKKPAIAFRKPELISPEYAKLNAQLHRENVAYGVGGGKYAGVVMKLKEAVKAESILDYGCLPRTSLVETENGLKPIKWIVDTRYTGRVKSLNKDGQFVWNRVVGYSSRANKPKRPWVMLKIGNQRTTVVCTADHQCAAIDNVLVPIVRYYPASDMLWRYAVRVPQTTDCNHENALYNEEQLAVLLGTLMGDATIKPGGQLRIGHSEKQKSYLLLKQAILGGRIVRARQSNYPGVVYDLYSIQNAQTKYLRELIYTNRHKNPLPILPYLDERSLAFWYMDDGYLAKPYHGRQRVTLHTEGFSEGEHKGICDWFAARWGFHPAIDRYTKHGVVQRTLRFRVEDSSNFFRLISPYVPVDMQYKLPAEFRHPSEPIFNCTPMAYSAALVLMLKTPPPENREYWSRLYDIEVEKDHNFVANRTVVHNCGKSYLQKSLGFPIWQYDPAIPELAESPRPADVLVSTDVLEHIEPEKLDLVLADMHRCCRKVAYFVVHTGPSSKVLADGRNAHILQRNKQWWSQKLSKFFVIGSIKEAGPLLHIVAAPKVMKQKGKV